MNLSKKLTLNHFSIRSVSLEATCDFYTKVIGLEIGPRPEFPFPGYWLYSGDKNDYANAVLHLIQIDPNSTEGLNNYLGDRKIPTLNGSGAIDHVAFFAVGLKEMLAHLNKLNIPCRERTVPVIKLHQVFIDDPNGIVIELNYPAHEKYALDQGNQS